MIRIHCNKADAILKETQTLTAGMANYPEVQLTFSDDWAGLAKAAVVRAGDVVKDVVIIDDGFTVPVECLADSGVNLIIGIHGVGDIGLPTVWCACGEILDGTDIDEADNVGTATQTLVDQLRVYAEDANEAAEEALENIIRSAVADGSLADAFGTAEVNATLIDDALHGGKQIKFQFVNLKGRSVDSFTVVAEGENKGRVQIRLEGEEPVNFDGLKEGLAELAELISDVETAEATRTSQEASRVSAETGRVNAETERVIAEEDREDAEDARAEAETARDTAEGEREIAEAGRESAESARVSAESARVTAENSRASAETARADAETGRVSAETNRASAESTRSANETTRASNEATRINQENSRISAEASRVSAESARASAETARASNESSRVSAETERSSAESARATAESGRVTAESGRVSAEAARVTSEEERAEEFATWEETIASKADAAEVEAEFIQQSQQIQQKADEAVEDARYKKQQTEIQFLLDAAKGQIAEVHTDTAEAYSKAVPTYTSASARFADVKNIGGHSEVVNGEIISADCDSIVSKDSEQTTRGQLNIPAGLREDYPLRSAGTSYDYLLFKQENGALKVEHHGKTGIVDLGSLNWTQKNTKSGKYYYKANELPNAKGGDNATLFNILCSTGISAATANSIYNEYSTGITLYFNGKCVIYYDGTDYESEEAFKAAMSGVYLIYEKVEEVVTDVTSYFPTDTITYLPVEDGGSLTFHQASTEFPIPNEEDFYYVLEGASA